MALDSRDLNDLEPETRAKAFDFLRRCKEDGLSVLVTNTYRPPEVQAALYAKGRTAPGTKVTNAKPGFSWHQFRCALDVVPLRDKKAVWGTSGEDGELWQRVGAHGRAAGLEWGGDWKKFKDMPHFQHTGGLTLGEMRVKYGTHRPKDFT